MQALAGLYTESKMRSLIKQDYGAKEPQIHLFLYFPQNLSKLSQTTFSYSQFVWLRPPTPMPSGERSPKTNLKMQLSQTKFKIFSIKSWKLLQSDVFSRRSPVLNLDFGNLSPVSFNDAKNESFLVIHL